MTTPPTPQKRPQTSIKFDKAEHDFGTVKFGETRELKIDFTNTGKEDLVIEFVQGGCTCTVPLEWTRKPIAPGQKGYVKIKFDSSLADIKDDYSSSVEIYANVQDDMAIYFLTADIVE